MSTVLTSPARVTTHKFASTSPPLLRQMFSLDPHSGVRTVVAGFAFTSLAKNQQLELAQALREAPLSAETLSHVESPKEIRGEVKNRPLTIAVLNKKQDKMIARAVYYYAIYSSCAQPEYVRSLRAGNRVCYTFRRSVAVTFNHDADGVIAEFSGVPIRGRGENKEQAIEELGAELDLFVQKHWKKPPHARTAIDDRYVRILDHLIDWDEYYRDNPVAQEWWFQTNGISGRNLQVLWHLGPHGRKGEGVISRADAAPELLESEKGSWFRAVVRTYPRGIRWERGPVRVSDPTNCENQRIAFDAMRKTVADERNVWPLRSPSQPEQGEN